MVHPGVPPLPGAGWRGLAVDTVLTNPSTRPGLALPGRVLVESAEYAVPIGHVVLGLVTRVEPEEPDEPRRLVEFHRFTASSAFVLPARRRRVIDFAMPLPWETPVTVINGHRLLDLRMGLRTELALDPMFDQGDLTGLYVHPLPAQEKIMSALSTLGFRLRQVGLQAGWLPGVRQAFPFHQKIGYWAAPLYAGPITELELTFITDRYGVEVIFWLDRRMAIAGSSHLSLSRFRITHQAAQQTDPIKLVDGWLRRALDRHADAAAGYLPTPPIRESAQVSRPPEENAPHRQEDAEGTAGGSGGGGGDGT